MAGFAGKTLGALLTLLGWDGTEFRNVKVDAEGHLQLDVLSVVLATDAATETTLATRATDAKLELVRLLLVSLAAEDFATQTTLALLLTELALKADLTETQPVSMASLPLPSGGATAANQATMITALQLIDDLRNALHSVGTDRLVVRLENQGFSFGDKLLDYKNNEDTGSGDVDLYSSTVPTGEVWVVTSVLALNTVTVNSMIYLYLYDSGVYAAFRRKVIPGIVEGAEWSGHMYMVPGDKILAQYGTCVLHDKIYLETLGYKMSMEVGSGPGPFAPGWQDFTGWTEVDEDSDIAVVADRLTVVTMRRDANSYVYLDMGADYFGDFLHYVTVRCNDIIGSGCFGYWGLSNGEHTLQDKWAVSAGLDFHCSVHATQGVVWTLRDCETENQDQYAGGYQTWLYLLIQRSGTTLTCKIYSNEARTTLVDTLTVVCATTKYRYVEAVQSRDGNGSSGDTMSGEVHDLGW